MKPLVIYHNSCADGFGAAFAAWLKLGDDAEYVPMQYGKDDVFKIPPWTARDVYILDFSLPRDYMDKIFSEAKRVVWLDHHKTAFEMWCGEIPEEGSWREDTNFMRGQHVIVLDNNKSGAMLAWEYFHPGTEVPILIRHIDDYDRWIFALKGTREINKALWSYAPWSFEQWKEIIDDDHYDHYGSMWTEGAAILRAHNQNVQSVVKSGARKCSIIPAIINSSDSYKAPWVWWHDEEHGDTCGANGLAANCPPHLTSDVGHELANQSGTFGLLWFIDEGNVCRCSLRSNGDYDVSAIAKAFGGGGHRNAAGFQVDIQTLLGWIK